MITKTFTVIMLIFLDGQIIKSLYGGLIDYAKIATNVILLLIVSFTIKDNNFISA